MFIIVGFSWTLEIIQSAGKVEWDVNNNKVKTERGHTTLESLPLSTGNIYGLFRCGVPWMQNRIEATAWSFKKKGNLEELSNSVPNYLLMGKPDYQKYTTSSSLCPSNLEEFQEYKKNYAANKSVFGYYRENMSCVFEICFLRIQIHQ